MDKKDEYFIPSIEDIRVGYECEIEDLQKGWIPMIMKPEYFTEFGAAYQIFSANKRVPYLTKEQIEKEGWVEGKKDRFTLQQITIIQDDNRTDWLVISENIKDKEQLVFKGECKDINTFRYICKLLGI